MKKQENLESNNFYVFLKVRRRIYFYYISGPEKHFFDISSRFSHLHESQPANYQMSLQHSNSVVFNNKFSWKRGDQKRLGGVQSRDEFYNP